MRHQAPIPSGVAFFLPSLLPSFDVQIDACPPPLRYGAEKKMAEISHLLNVGRYRDPQRQTGREGLDLSLNSLSFLYKTISRDIAGSSNLSSRLDLIRSD